MLNGQWFQVNGSLKGYKNYKIDETADKATEKWNGFIYTTFDSGTSSYVLTTCILDSDGTTYIADSTQPISINAIYGDSDQRQLWNLKLHYGTNNDYLNFNGILLVPILFMDVKLDKNNAFRSASFKTEGCIGYDTNVLGLMGSCTLKGKTVPLEKVPAGARFTCMP